MMTTMRKTRSLTRADQKLHKDEEKKGGEQKLLSGEEQKVKVKANSSALKSSNQITSSKKVGKRSLDLVLVDLKKGKEEPEEVVANEKDDEEVVEIENDFLEEVRNTSFNANDSAEAQEIIRNLTNQLSSQEDKYVEMKAENLSKDQKIRKLSQNLNTVGEKFESFKSDRADLVKYMQLNVNLIKKLEVVNEAVKMRDAEIESIKNTGFYFRKSLAA